MIDARSAVACVTGLQVGYVHQALQPTRRILFSHAVEYCRIGQIAGFGSETWLPVVLRHIGEGGVGQNSPGV